MTAPRTAPAPSSAGSSESDRLAREVSLLEAARARLETDPAAALAGLNAHAAEFPSGMLGMEREMLAIDALRRMGRVAEARTRARALLEKARGSIYEDRVRAILEALPAPP